MHRNYYKHLHKAHMYEHVDDARSVRHAERAKYYASFGSLVDKQEPKDEKVVENEKVVRNEKVVENEKGVENDSVKIIESTGKTNNKIIVQYLQCLFKMTRDLGLCFTSGAYIIDDKTGKLKKQLEIALGTRKPLKRTFETHDRFDPHREGFCPGICELHIDENELEVDCNDGREYIRPIRNIKFYSFGKEEGEEGRWVYLKCESSTKTYSLTHAWSAFLRYYWGIENRSKRASRREDCGRLEDVKQGDNNRRKRKACVCTPEKPCVERYHDEPKFIRIVDQVFPNEQTRVFKHLRNYPGDRLDEYFVGNSLSDFILYNLDKLLHLKDNPVFMRADSDV